MVQREDAGSYFCNASNDYGSLVSQYLTLRVSGESSFILPLRILSFFVSPAVPLAPTELGLNSLSSTSADIRWDRVSSSYPPVHVRPHPLLMNIHDPPLLQTYHVEYRLNLDSRPWVEHNVPSNPNSFKITSKYIYCSARMTNVYGGCYVQVSCRMPATW